MEAQMKRGFLEACVLAAVSGEESYGYQIVKDVPAGMGLTESTLYPLLKRLEKKGFVERRVDPRDRRYKRVRLTARCRELTEQIGRQGQKTFDQFFRGFTPGELETLNQLLERLLENCGEPPQTNHRPEETE